MHNRTDFENKFSVRVLPQINDLGHFVFIKPILMKVVLKF